MIVDPLLVVIALSLVAFVLWRVRRDAIRRDKVIAEYEAMLKATSWYAAYEATCVCAALDMYCDRTNVTLSVASSRLNRLLADKERYSVLSGPVPIGLVPPDLQAGARTYNQRWNTYQQQVVQQAVERITKENKDASEETTR